MCTVFYVIFCNRLTVQNLATVLVTNLTVFGRFGSFIFSDNFRFFGGVGRFDSCSRLRNCFHSLCHFDSFVSFGHFAYFELLIVSTILGFVSFEYFGSFGHFDMFNSFGRCAARIT